MTNKFQGQTDNNWIEGTTQSGHNFRSDTVLNKIELICPALEDHCFYY